MLENFGLFGQLIEELIQFKCQLHKSEWSQHFLRGLYRFNNNFFHMLSKSTVRIF